jgi:biopolymer transport protein ExbD
MPRTEGECDGPGAADMARVPRNPGVISVRPPRSSLPGLDRDYGGMTPMIDVVFNLLIFFVVGAGSFAADRLLATRLSAASGLTANVSQPEERPAWAFPVDLRLKQLDGTTIVDMSGTTYRDRTRLKDQLRALSEVSKESPINLEIAPDVPLGEMIDVYDTCQAAGFETINFVTTTRVVGAAR